MMAIHLSVMLNTFVKIAKARKIGFFPPHVLSPRMLRFQCLVFDLRYYKSVVYIALPSDFLFHKLAELTGIAFLLPFPDNLFFRFVGESGVPVIRQVAWYNEPSMRIMGMAFDPTAQWCMVVTTDMTIVLIPIYYMMMKKDSQSNDESVRIIIT
jgi:hypothetical protein